MMPDGLASPGRAQRLLSAAERTPASAPVCGDLGAGPGSLLTETPNTKISGAQISDCHLKYGQVKFYTRRMR